MKLPKDLEELRDNLPRYWSEDFQSIHVNSFNIGAKAAFESEIIKALVSALECIAIDNVCPVHGPGDPCDRNIANKGLEKWLSLTKQETK
jgi:hypothetical protein